MSVQIPVLVWTVLCFIALYFILKYWLFTPVLSLMDKREKKINDAKAEKEEAERAAAECQAQELAKQEEAQNRSREEIKAEAEKVRLEEKHLLEDAKKAHIETVEAHRAKTDAAFADDMKRADAPLGALAERFLSRLNAN